MPTAPRPRWRPDRVARALALATVGVVCAGCATSAEPQPGPGLAADLGLTAEVVQYRRDAQRDVLQVKVANGGAQPVHVTEVNLRTPTFTGPVVAGKDSTIAPGVAADLTLPLGAAACADAAAADPHVVVLTVDGQTVELPVDGGTLEQVRDERCRVQAVADHVHLAVADGWHEAGTVGGEPALRGSLLVTPRPGADLMRVAVEGATTLFTVAEPEATELAAGAGDPVALDVVLTVTRCDPHAVAEDKKGYLLPVRVAVGDAEPVLVEVAVPAPERGPLQDLVDRTCRSGT